ncbi:hypothetical protein F383_29207 [Gossypium arboreum]|uniref:Uncharacterized protein n=1 Tax=Gossypium arboreum TaxID=29729 RepID=A0A0B0PEP5_GOSAR|nr:hypothetical protein F383_29207 [Gossypium arboreum]
MPVRGKGKKDDRFDIVDDALILFNKMIVSTILKGLCKSGNTDRAVGFLRLMEGRGFEPNIVKGIKPNIITYSCLIHGMCDSGQQEKATTLLNEMLDNNISLNIVTYTILIDILCKEGMISKAVETIDMMRKQGNLKEALKFFQTMQNGGLELDIVPYTILIDGLCKAGHIEVAKELFRQLSDSGLKPNVYKYGVMINGLCKEGLPDEQTCFLGAWEIMTVCLIVAVIM